MFSVDPFVIPWTVASIVVVLLVFFVVGYFLPAWRLGFRLSRALRGLRSIHGEASCSPPDDAVAAALGADATLRHLWVEYAETLLRPSLRATAPANFFFSTQVLVDTPMRVEFFRHLPGILTGIGIIGTFSGLIVGLEGFDAQGSAEAIQHSLGGLLHGVREAFYASTLAIAVAMAITFVEKLVLNRRYRQVEELAQAIDGLYRYGSGEEYLAELVAVVRENSTEVRDMAGGIAASLAGIEARLAELGTAQDERLAAAIAGAVSKGLAAPLAQMVAPTRSLEARLAGLAEELAATGAASRKAMGEQVDALLERSGKTQALQQAQLVRFLDDVRLANTATQEETHRRLAEAMEGVGLRLQQWMEQIDRRQGEAARDDAARRQSLDQRAGEMAARMQEELGQSLAAQRESSRALDSSLAEMAVSAQAMHAAAERFIQAGHLVGGVLEKGERTFSSLADAGHGLAQGAASLDGVRKAMDQTGERLGGMMDALRLVAEDARREAGVSAKLVADLEAVTARMAEAEAEMGRYLDQVSGVLEAGFNNFGDAVGRNLARANGEFHDQLARSVGLIARLAEELAASLPRGQGR